MIRDDQLSSEVSYWPSVSDLFMTLFIIAVALAGAVLFVFLPRPLDPNKPAITVTVEYITSLGGRIRELEDEVTSLRAGLDAVQRERMRLEQELAQCRKQRDECIGSRPMDDKPPIITIADSGVFFPAGSAIVGPEFESYLHARGFVEIASEIIRRNGDGTLNVDTLEVIGHTDGVPLKRGSGNLDAALPKVLAGSDAAISSLLPGSNNDLGLLRALAIKQAWQRFIADHADRVRLEPIEVRTYSAGQTLPVEPGRFDGEDPRARRIELRLTKLLE